jgi:hypothetical protein
VATRPTWLTWRPRPFDANRELILYGSDEVLTEYQAWQRQARDGLLDFPRLGSVIVAVRRDMGHPKTKVDRRRHAATFHHGLRPREGGGRTGPANRVGRTRQTRAYNCRR